MPRLATRGQIRLGDRVLELSWCDHEWGYESMRSLAQRFAVLPRAPTRAASASLDGGIEAAYVHRQPLIRGNLYGPVREARPGDVQRKLRRDFDVRYVWADSVKLSSLREVFPDARTVLGNGSYFVLELPPISGGVCDG